MPAPGYAVLVVWHAGESDGHILSAGGKVVIFDTPETARNYLPLLGKGRVTEWTDADSAFWLPEGLGDLLFGVNRAQVGSDYDPYNAPVGLYIPRAEDGFKQKVFSESRRKAWRYHILWNHAYTDCGQWVTNSDGERVNTAL